MIRIVELSLIGLFSLVACSGDPNQDPVPPANAASLNGTGMLDAGAANPEGPMCMRDRAAPVAKQVNIVADQPGVAAVADSNLVNAWGLAFNPQGVAWISANGTGLAIAYDSTGAEKIAVTVPPPAGGQPPSAPTGQVFNGDSNAFMGDLFIFVTEDGTVSGWKPSDATNAVLRVDNSATQAVYKGVTLAKAGGKSLLIAADFHNAKIDVFDDQYKPVTKQHPAFVDPCLPAGYAPFNVLARGNHVFVTYALQNDEKKDDVKGPGNGFVDIYDLGGRLTARLISRGALNSPWGLAFKADDKTGTLELLVGNFGDGRINVYELSGHRSDIDAKLIGQMADPTGKAITIDGLWSIAFGPGAGGFAADELYFTAGPNDEQNGLFGKLILQ
jgi:uncharacterized protein (TIGR03118 family)